MYAAIQSSKGCSIAYNCQIKGIPCIPHFHGIFIAGDAIIGKNCVIFQHVTIGSNTLPDSKGLGAPNIGNNCYIGAGAKIIGNVNVGHNVRIGANCIVSQDVPDNSVVVLSGSTIIKKENMINRFYSWGTIDGYILTTETG